MIRAWLEGIALGTWMGLIWWHAGIERGEPAATFALAFVMFVVPAGLLLSGLWRVFRSRRERPRPAHENRA